MTKKASRRPQGVPGESGGGPDAPDETRYSTRIVEDVFTDEVALLKPRFEVDVETFIVRLREANPEIHQLLAEAVTLEAAREALYEYLERCERAVFDRDNDLHILEKATVRECVRTFRSTIGPVNELRTGVSALECLWRLAREGRQSMEGQVSVGFLMEYIALFRGVKGNSGIYLENGRVTRDVPEFLRKRGRSAAVARMETLDLMGTNVRKYLKKYPSGLEEEVAAWRAENRRRILRYFKADEEEWNDPAWQLRHVIREAKPLLDLIELTADQAEAVAKAAEHKIPFGVTPYYLSLMDSKLSIGYDHAVRTQVIPPKSYVDMMVEHRSERGIQFDFMGEHDTSPMELITRRYPGIAIFKPFNTCAQICVYCQRNWEIDEVLAPEALASREAMEQALAWFDEHRSVGDVLITGGDPAVMKDIQWRWLLENLAAKSQVYRVRIGTRIPVVLPMRVTDAWADLLAEFHEPGRRDIAMVTHFEHSYEITPEAMEAVQKIRRRGMNVYNQQVFTVENSRRFETAKLRLDLKSIGVEPYYVFNMKGKEETRRYMVPIARLMQERKEEARLLPGLDRTDEPVFNVPRLGKNQLQAWQDHRVVMIRPDGSRVYEFHPWEKHIALAPPYNYVDVPIYEYLEELAARGENIREYRTIWYYY